MYNVLVNVKCFGITDFSSSASPYFTPIVLIEAQRLSEYSDVGLSLDRASGLGLGLGLEALWPRP